MSLPLGQQEKDEAQNLLMDCQKGIREVNEKFQAIVKTVSMVKNFFSISMFLLLALQDVSV